MAETIDLGTVTEALNNKMDLDGANAASDIHLVANTASAHNGVYRGKNLTDIYTMAQLSAKIQANDWSDLYIGDYIEVTMTSSYGTETVRWLFAGFDTHLNRGDTATTKHHICLVPEDCFAKTQQMNSTNTTGSGYVGSAMWTTILPEYATAISNAFGSHLLTHRKLLTNSMNVSAASMAGAGWTGASSGWAWTDTKITLLNEVQVYGTTVFSSSFHDIGDSNQQLPLFALAPDHIVCGCGLNSSARVHWWLSTVASSTNFARVHNSGDANSGASYVELGVRPYILFN